MVSLSDIAHLTKAVKYGAQEIVVYGVSAHGVAVIVQRFPAFVSFLMEKKLDVPQLIAQAPDLVAALIAAGCGEAGSDKAIANAALLPLETQMDLIEAIIALTMPSGPAPFLKRLTGLLNSIAGQTGAQPAAA